MVVKNLKKLRFQSQAVRAGERGPLPDFSPTVAPIYASSTFCYEKAEDMDAVFPERPLGRWHPGSI